MSAVGDSLGADLALIGGEVRYSYTADWIVTIVAVASGGLAGVGSFFALLYGAPKIPVNIDIYLSAGLAIGTGAGAFRVCRAIGNRILNNSPSDRLE